MSDELKPPKKIYLQMLDEDGEEQDEITWCEDEINDTDIAYVLESALTTAQEENKRYKDALEEMLKIFDREGTAPRINGYSIGAMACDRAQSVLKDGMKNE